MSTPGSTVFEQTTISNDRIRGYHDSATGSSDKVWTVPARELWKLIYVHVRYTASAVVGNRQITVQILDVNGELMIDTTAGGLISDNGSEHLAFLQGIGHEDSFMNHEIEVPIATDQYLQPGCVLRIFDESATDPAGDYMEVAFQVHVSRV